MSKKKQLYFIAGANLTATVERVYELNVTFDIPPYLYPVPELGTPDPGPEGVPRYWLSHTQYLTQLYK